MMWVGSDFQAAAASSSAESSNLIPFKFNINFYLNCFYG